MTPNLQERGFRNPYWEAGSDECGHGTWVDLYSTGIGGNGVFLSPLWHAPASGRAAVPVLITVFPLQVSRMRPYGQPVFRT